MKAAPGGLQAARGAMDFSQQHTRFLVRSYDPFANVLAMTMQLLGLMYTLRSAPAAQPRLNILSLALVLLRFAVNRLLSVACLSRGSPSATCR
jgi:hypothetical protein